MSYDVLPQSIFEGSNILNWKFFFFLSLLFFKKLRFGIRGTGIRKEAKELVVTQDFLAPEFLKFETDNFPPPLHQRKKKGELMENQTGS